MQLYTVYMYIYNIMLPYIPAILTYFGMYNIYIYIHIISLTQPNSLATHCHTLSLPCIYSVSLAQTAQRRPDVVPGLISAAA